MLGLLILCLCLPVVFGGERQVAYGLSSGQLVIVDAASGDTRYRAALSGPIRQIASGDLDGDGLDELLVVQGRNLALLRAARPDGLMLDDSLSPNVT